MTCTAGATIHLPIGNKSWRLCIDLTSVFLQRKPSSALPPQASWAGHSLVASSPRVTTFLSTASSYQNSLRHLAVSANIPSVFASCNAPVCDDPHCQICIFISKAEEPVVCPISAHAACLQTQLECPDLRYVHSHLKQGTRPSKKLTNISDVKRYLNITTLSRDGLLVAK